MDGHAVDFRHRFEPGDDGVEQVLDVQGFGEQIIGPEGFDFRPAGVAHVAGDGQHAAEGGGAVEGSCLRMSVPSASGSMRSSSKTWG